MVQLQGRDQQKKVGSLSGGERNRVHLAKLLRRGSNLLLLDEPTNDLDVDTLRALEDALLNFAGCAVVISHDRWFLDRIATHILAFEGDSEVVWFEGNYQDYEADRKRRLGAAADQPHRIRNAGSSLARTVSHEGAKTRRISVPMLLHCSFVTFASSWLTVPHHKAAAGRVAHRHTAALRCAPRERRRGAPGSRIPQASRTVIKRVAVSMVAIWKESFVSSFDEKAPFIGESTRNVCRTTRWPGPIQS